METEQESLTSPEGVWARQAPLRALYAENPEAARAREGAVTRSERVPAADPFRGEVEIGLKQRIPLRFGPDEAVGGLGELPSPVELLCGALAACGDGTIRMAAHLLGVHLEDLSVRVEGEADLRGAMAMDPSVKVGLQTLEYEVKLRAAPETDPRLLRKLVEVAERHCIVLDTLRSGVDVSIVEDHGGEPVRSADGRR